MKLAKILISITISLLGLPFLITMPMIFWNCNWGEIHSLFGNTYDQDFNNLLNRLNLTKETCAQWATQRIWIGIAATIGIFFLLIIIMIIPTKRKQKDKIKNDTKEQVK